MIFTSTFDICSGGENAQERNHIFLMDNRWESHQVYIQLEFHSNSIFYCQKHDSGELNCCKIGMVDHIYSPCLSYMVHNSVKYLKDVIERIQKILELSYDKKLLTMNT